MPPRHALLRIRIRAEGLKTARATRFVFIGNNEYEMNAFTYSASSRFDSGKLYLYVARGRGRLELIGVLLLGLLRDLKQTDRFDSWSMPEFSIEMRQRSIPVYLDGEVMVLETPLRYRTRVHGLRVILPEKLP